MNNTDKLNLIKTLCEQKLNQPSAYDNEDMWAVIAERKMADSILTIINQND